MHVLSPAGKIIVASASIKELAGWTLEEVVGQDMSALIHPDDLASFQQSFQACLQSGEPLTTYYRFRTKDDRYILFETTGRPHFNDTDGVKAEVGGAASAASPRTEEAKCFFGMSRPYPSKNQAMLDSFLELKFENERLRQELQVMYKDIEASAASTEAFGEHQPPR